MLHHKAKVLMANPPPPCKGTWGHYTCAQERLAESAEGKFGLSVAYKTKGTFLSHEGVFFFLHRLNSFAEYGMSLQATAWVKT